MMRRKYDTSEAKVPLSVYEGLEWYWQGLALIVAVMIVYSQQPDAILKPQFIIDDVQFFQDAHSSNFFLPLLHPYTGYFQTLPRLVSALALLVPIKFAPLLFALVGVAVQVLPVFILLSERLAYWGTLRYRAFLALLYLALPNCAEIHITLTEAQWHLAFCALLLALAQEPRRTAWRVFDYGVLGLSALTGPFAMMLVPVTFWYRWRIRSRLSCPTTTILMAGATIQFVTLLFDGSRLHGAPYGDPRYLLGILAGQIYAGTLLGHNSLGAQLQFGDLVAIAAIGSLTVIWWARRAAIWEKCVASFALEVLFFTVAFPLIVLPSGFSSGWHLLAAAPAVRYWFFPTLVCAWMIASLLTDNKSEPKRLVGVVLFLAMLFGIVRDWHVPTLRVQIQNSRLLDGGDWQPGLQTNTFALPLQASCMNNGRNLG